MDSGMYGSLSKGNTLIWRATNVLWMNSYHSFMRSLRVHSAIENRREGAFTLTCVSGSACPPAGNLTRRRDALRRRSSGAVMRSAARHSAGAAPRRAPQGPHRAAPRSISTTHTEDLLRTCIRGWAHHSFIHLDCIIFYIYFSSSYCCSSTIITF